MCIKYGRSCFTPYLQYRFIVQLNIPLLLYAEKKSQGVRKNFPIYTEKFQLGGRNYLFISVTNRYAFLIFLINVVKNRKIIPLIYKPKNQWVEPNYFSRLENILYYIQENLT